MDGEQLNSFGSARRLVLRVEAKAPNQQTTPHETLEKSLPTPPAHLDTSSGLSLTILWWKESDFWFSYFKTLHAWCLPILNNHGLLGPELFIVRISRPINTHTRRGEASFEVMVEEEVCLIINNRVYRLLSSSSLLLCLRARRMPSPPADIPSTSTAHSINHYTLWT